MNLKKIEANIFYICIVLWCISSVLFGRTTIEGVGPISANTIYTLGRYTVYMLLIVKILMQKNMNKQIMVVGGVVFSLILVSSFLADDRVLISMVLFVLASRGAKQEIVLKVYGLTHLIMCLLVWSLCVIGVIDSNLMYRGTVERVSFGFSHPNSLAIEIIILVLVYVTYKAFKLTKVEYIVIGLVIISLYLLSDSRGATLVLVQMMICSMFISVIPKTIKDKWLQFFAYGSICISNIVTLWSIFFFNSSNSIHVFLDNILSKRFELLNSKYLVDGVSFIGAVGEGTNVIDNSYGRILLISGVIPYIIVVLFLGVSIVYIFRRNKMALILYSSVILLSFVENVLFRLEYNFLLVLIGIYLWEIFEDKTQKGKMKILTQRGYNKGISHQVLFEWEDDFSEIFDAPLEYLDNDQKHIISRIMRKYFGGRTISWNEDREINIFLIMHVYALELFSWYKQNLIPVIFDVMIEDLDDLNRMTKNVPLYYVTSLSIYEKIKEKYPLSKVMYMPQSVASKHIKEIQYDKEIDFIQFGRRNPILHDFTKKYCDENEGKNYYYRHKKAEEGMVKYTSEGIKEVGTIDSREEFIELLEKAKISLCSTPLAENTRDFGIGVDFLTARWFESVAKQCFILARWTDESEEEVKFTGLKEVASMVKNYEEFAQYADSYLKNNIVNIQAQRIFLEENVTKYRAKQVKEDLQKLKIID